MARTQVAQGFHPFPLPGRIREPGMFHFCDRGPLNTIMGVELVIGTVCQGHHRSELFNPVLFNLQSVLETCRCPMSFGVCFNKLSFPGTVPTVQRASLVAILRTPL